MTHTNLISWQRGALVSFMGLALALTATGCTMNAQDDGAGGKPNSVGPAQAAEATGNTAQELDPSWTTGPYTWQQGRSATPMMPDSTHVCVLTRIGGNFMGAGEQVHVYHQNGTWYLGGSSYQQGIHGEAYCFAMNGFYGPGTARWLSGELSTSNTGSSSYIDTWWGDATTFISGMSGNFSGGGEYINVWESGNGYTPSQLTAHTSQNAYIGGNAHSFFVGQPSSGVTAKYSGGNYLVESASSTNGSTPVTEVFMAPTAEAMCHFTRITGEFDGGGEYVVIYPKRDASNVERWTLRAVAGTADSSGLWPRKKYVSATAKCFKRNQN